MGWFAEQCDHVWFNVTPHESQRDQGPSNTKDCIGHLVISRLRQGYRVGEQCADGPVFGSWIYSGRSGHNFELPGYRD